MLAAKMRAGTANHLDMWLGDWNWTDRILTFISVGIAMVSAGFLYNKYSEKIRQFL